MVKQIPDFEKQTGIKVSLVNIDYTSRIQKTTLDLGSQTGNFDVFWTEGTYIGRFADQMHALEPLDTLAASLGVDLGVSDFSPQLIKNFSSGGHVYGIPFENTLMMVAVRKDIYQSMGVTPPTTLADYLQAVQKLNTPPVYGNEIMGQKGEPVFYEYVNWLWGEGGTLFDSAGAPTLDTPQALKAVEDLQALSKSAPAGTTTFGWDNATTSFAQGTVANAVLFSDQTGGLLDPSSSKVIGKWDYVPFPGTANTAFGGYSWGMNAFSKNKPAALAFIQWATSPGVLKSLLPGGSSPPRTSILSDAALQAQYPWLTAEAAASSRAVVPTSSPQYFDLVDALSTNLNAVLAGAMTPQAALADAQAKWTQLLKK